MHCQSMCYHCYQPASQQDVDAACKGQVPLCQQHCTNLALAHQDIHVLFAFLTLLRARQQTKHKSSLLHAETGSCSCCMCKGAKSRPKSESMQCHALTDTSCRAGPAQGQIHRSSLMQRDAPTVSTLRFCRLRARDASRQAGCKQWLPATTSSSFTLPSFSSCSSAELKSIQWLNQVS